MTNYFLAIRYKSLTLTSAHTYKLRLLIGVDKYNTGYLIELEADNGDQSFDLEHYHQHYILQEMQYNGLIRS